VVDDQGAISARRDQIAALPRPQVSEQGPDLKAAVEAVREIPDLWHLYARDWVWRFTSTKVGDEGREECWAYFTETFEGRVLLEEVDVQPTSEISSGEWPWRLALFLPNLKGAFKLKSDAEVFLASRVLVDPVIVARNSKEEFALKNYGTKKLLVK
jgi:hypothetical protein